MDLSLIQKLSEYCDQLIGEGPVSKSVKKSKKRKNKCEQDEVSKNLDNIATSLERCKRKKKRAVKEETTDPVVVDNHTALVNSGVECTQISVCDDSTKKVDKLSNANVGETLSGSVVTDDGFKIVSSIPEDDSDVSDAFESDIEEENLVPQNKNVLKATNISSEVKTTEDGFKIISDIPPDDSDVSDAFTDEEEEEEECDGTGEELVTQKKRLNSERTLSKPILQLMNDFGLDEDVLKVKQPEVTDGKALKDKLPETVFAVKNSKKKKKKPRFHNTATLASKRKPEVAVTVYNYTQTRGNKKKGASKKAKVDNSDMPRTKEQLERDMKRMRFEIFKLGVTGFEKEQKKQSRIALAIKLGAKPPKNKHVSYKDLLATKKQEKIKEIEKREMNKEMGVKEKRKFKSNPKDKRKKPRAYTAQVGRFKDGVQYLSKKDLAKIQRS